MARALTLALAALASGCFHAEPYSSKKTLATWRAMQEPKASSAGGAGARKAEPPAPGAALTAEQAYQLALAQSPELAVLDARSEVAAAQVGAARQLDNPQLRLTNFNIDDAIAGGPGMNIGLRVPIPRPGTVRARVKGAELGAEAQESAADDARRQLRGRVYKLFARMAMLTADREQALRAAELRRARRDLIGARVQQSVSTRLDAALAEVAYAEAHDETARIDAELGRLHGELERLIGAGPQQFQLDPGELQLRDTELDEEALTARAMESRPELRGVQTRVGQAKADLHLARSKAWPWFDWAQIQYRAGPNATPASFGFGVALTLPIFSWNRGEVRASRALVRQRELEERAKIAAVAAEVDEAAERARRTAKRAQELEGTLLPQIEAAGREADAALAAGGLDPLVANDIAAKTVAARRVLLAAKLEHREALIDLETAVGGPLPR